MVLEILESDRKYTARRKITLGMVTGGETLERSRHPFADADDDGCPLYQRGKNRINTHGDFVGDFAFELMVGGFSVKRYTTSRNP